MDILRQYTAIAIKSYQCTQVCTSTSVKVVLETLLNKGAQVMARSGCGDTPLHTECRRYQ